MLADQLSEKLFIGSGLLHQVVHIDGTPSVFLGDIGHLGLADNNFMNYLYLIIKIKFLPLLKLGLLFC